MFKAEISLCEEVFELASVAILEFSSLNFPRYLFVYIFMQISFPGQALFLELFYICSIRINIIAWSLFVKIFKYN